MNTTERQKTLAERWSLAAKRVTARMARGNINLTLGRYMTEHDIKSRLREAAAGFRNAK